MATNSLANAQGIIEMPWAEHQALSNQQNSAGTERLTPQGYANAVLGFSKLPGGEGRSYEHLADFLTTTHPPPAFNTNDTNSQVQENFVTLYRLRQLSQDEPAQGKAASDLKQQQLPVIHFRSFEEFAAFELPPQESHQSQLLFLRGFPSAQWLNLIGSKYHIDPEYFCRHLDFRPTEDLSNDFSYPSPPSSLWHLIQLPMSTIGFRDTVKSHVDQGLVDTLREQGVRALATHHRKLFRGFEMGVCDSMIRQYRVFDEAHFSIEQRISICMKETGQTFVILIWLDSGNGLGGRTEGPWSPEPAGLKATPTAFLPVIRHRPDVALKCHLISPIPHGTSGLFRGQPQSATLLHLDYGRALRRSIMARDAFYALNDVFTFAASSESQLLNLINTKLDMYTQPGRNEADSLPNLKYAKRILYEHIQQIQEVKQSIFNAKHRKWPKATDEAGKRANLAAEGLEQNYDYLLLRAQTMHTRCTEAIAVLMNSMAIAESQEAIVQAKRVTKLTFLAFIFVPLSFTTSVFGMNVRELDQNQISLWAWFALSVPMLALTITLFYVDFSVALGKLYKWQ